MWMRRMARRLVGALLTLGALLALTLALFLLPPVVHFLLERSGAAAELGVNVQIARSLSDELVWDLLIGGSFDVPLEGSPLLSAAERAHLVDVGAIFRALMVGGAISLTALGAMFVRRRRIFYEALFDGALLLGIGAALVGGAFLLAFDATFTFAHELLFPAGGWTFDPASDRLVQLYPTDFWVMAATSYCTVLLGAAVFGFTLARKRRR